jgi:ubiquinone/menaquinone biosynthesis C-methylase UbiE
MDTFYDHHPFDGLGDEKSAQERYEALPLHQSVLNSLDGKIIVEVGCGTGQDVGYAARKGLKVIGLDLSLRSLQIMHARCKQAAVCANNMALPLMDSSVDGVMSSGVLHHTAKPEQSFAELARVVKPDGYLYLAVYKDRGRYWFLYTFVGSVFRFLIDRGGRLGRMVVHSTALPPYWLAHKIKSRGRRSWAEAKSQFYDYFITPIVHFLPKDMILNWARDANLLLTGYDTNGRFNVHSFVFRRKEQ